MKQAVGGRRYKVRCTHLWALLMASCAGPVWAQDMVPADRDAIIVIGGALADLSGDTDAVAIDSVALEHNASERVENALRDIAGLQQFRRSDARSAHPTSQGMTLRGLGGNAASRVAVTLDGVPITDPFGGWVNWPSIQSERLGAVRVQRGGGNLSQGSGAVAGTMQLFSANNPADHAPFSGNVAYGSRDSIAARAMVAGNLGSTGSALAAFQFERSDGFIPIAKGRRGSVDQAAPYEQASLALRSVVEVNDTTEAQFVLSGFRDRRNRGTDFTDSQTIGSDMSARLVNRGALPWSMMVYGQLREMRSGFASVNADRNVATATLDQYRVPATGWGAAFVVQPAKGVQLGTDARFMDGESRERYTFVSGVPTRLRKAGGKARTLGAYVGMSRDVIAPLTLDASARIDHWRLSNGVLDEHNMTGAVINDIRHPVRNGWEPSGNIGLHLRAADALTVRASAYTNWRLPTLNELYRPYRVGADAIAANAALKPERVKGGEMGVAYDDGHITIMATAFANRLEQAIANVTLAQGPGVFPGVGFVSATGRYKQRQNLDAIEAKGIELDARLMLGSGVRLGGSYAFTDATVDAKGTAAAPLDGLRPAQVARHSGSARADWNGRNADAFIVARYVGPQFEDDQNSIRLKSALTFDAGISVVLNQGLRLDVRAENLTDKLVEATRSSTGVIERATPRTFWVGLRYKP